VIKNVFAWSVFAPTYQFKSITNVTPMFLLKNGIMALIVDKDETLMGTGENLIRPEIANWVKGIRNAGIKVVISSNSARVGAVKKCSKELGVEYVLCGPAYIWGKPWISGFTKALKILGSTPCETAVIGDQLMTDIWGGNCAKLRTILVQPLSGKDRIITKLTGRLIERWILRGLSKRMLLPCCLQE